MYKKLFTSESVTEGHPDKLCDQISDSILDAYLAVDPMSRVACEVVSSSSFVIVTGEITSYAHIDIDALVRKTIEEIGYTKPEYGFDYKTCSVFSSIKKQSPDIAMGVNNALESRGVSSESHLTGAGDQGIIFGYACNETDTYMPMPIMLAHKMAKRLSEIRKSGLVPYLRPDGKTQVTVEYDDGKVARIDTIVVSTQHDPGIDNETIKNDIIEHVVKDIIPKELIDENTKYYINPTGQFIIGGPVGDAGLTGRKIIVDTYGGYARHGGGAFSGKDPSKVDRSAAYAARYAAKNVVAAGLADKCELQLGYAIGVAHPVSIMVDTFGTGKIDETEIAKIISQVFDFTPDGIVKMLNLRRPIYRNTASYGHFGRDDCNFTWEETDKVNELIKLSKI